MGSHAAKLANICVRNNVSQSIQALNSLNFPTVASRAILTALRLKNLFLKIVLRSTPKLRMHAVNESFTQGPAQLKLLLNCFSCGCFSLWLLLSSSRQR